MNQSKIPRSLIEEYVTEIAKENGLLPTHYSELQWRVMGEKMDQFVSLYNGDMSILLMFMYIWYNYQGFDYEQIPWEQKFNGEKIPKEQLQQMLNTWSSLKIDVIEFTRINKKLLEQQRKQEFEQER